MYQTPLEWKEFNVNLLEVDAWLRANAGEHYAGIAAAAELTVWFMEDPGSVIVTACQDYWNAITEESSEATSYLTELEIQAAIAILRANLHAKEWSEMSVAERKLVVGQTPTRAELGL